MKCRIVFIFFLSIAFSVPLHCYAQEEEKLEVEESAEVYLEEYTDEFQETFFEALKQKGIQNYDRAVNLLLKCKQLDADNVAVDHELAKANYLAKNYESAKTYAIEALISRPENYWFLNTLVEVMSNSGGTVESVRHSIPYENGKLKENLATIYFKRSNYYAALDIIKALKKSDFTDELALKINDSLQKIEAISKGGGKIEVENEENPVEQIKEEISILLSESDYETALEKATEATETFPLQPYFYYAQGLALNKGQKYQEAIEVLESGLIYLFDDDKLANQFYAEIAAAHKALGNLSKANEYLSKVKSGL